MPNIGQACLSFILNTFRQFGGRFGVVTPSDDPGTPVCHCRCGRPLKVSDVYFSDCSRSASLRA